MAHDRAMRRTPLVAGIVLLAAVGTSRSANAPDPCCFTNEAYAGVCEVVPAQGETCDSILAYLNTPNSTGKGYCANTTIRGGWRQAICGGPRSIWSP